MEQKELLNLNQFNTITKKSFQNNTAAKKIIIYQSKSYFYKTYQDINQAYYEIITYKLAEKLKMNTAKYQLVTLNHEIGTISENFNPNDMPIISLYEILESFKQQNKIPSTTNSLNNLENIEQAIFCYTKDKQYTAKIMEELKNIFLLQILVGDLDRRPKNILFFQFPKLQLAPNFDYNGAFSIDLKNNFFIPYGLGTTYNGTQFFDTYQTISDFIKKEQNLQDLKLKCFYTGKYIPTILSELEQVYQIQIPEEVKKHVLETIHNNITTMLDLEKQKSKKGQSR